MHPKALILAAGKGERMGHLTEDKPKALVQLLGLTLIERALLTAKQAGIKEFVIVVGYLGDRIREELGDGSRHDVKITYVENEEWTRGNGISALKAKGSFEENFILLMADHIFDSDILKGLMTRDFKSSVVAAVDRRRPSPGDTKVLEEDGRIVEIGKNVEKANCVDTGIFLCAPAVFSYVEKAIEQGRTELADGIGEAARNGDAEVFDITKAGGNVFGGGQTGKPRWVDIDTEEDLKRAEEMLCRSLTKPTDGPVSRFLNRPISVRISKLLTKTRIRPNSISFISFVIGSSSAVFFCFGSYLSIIVAGLLAQICSIFDGCDGEVARLKFQDTSYGGWFDAVLDRYADAAIILGMIYGYWALGGYMLIWIVGSIALIGTFMNSYTAGRYDTFLKKKTKTKGIGMRMGRDVRLFLIMIGALLNQVFLILAILAILTNVESLRRLVVLRNE